MNKKAVSVLSCKLWFCGLTYTKLPLPPLVVLFFKAGIALCVEWKKCPTDISSLSQHLYSSLVNAHHVLWHILSEPCLIKENTRKASQLNRLTRSVRKTSARLILAVLCNMSDMVMCDFSKVHCSRKCKCVLWFRVKGNREMYQMRLPTLPVFLDVAKASRQNETK